MQTSLTILFNILIVLLSAFMWMLIYSYRSTYPNFDLYCWFATNKTRFIVAAMLGIPLSIFIVIVPGIDIFFNLIGFEVVGAAPVSVGFSLGAFLIAGVSGNKPK